MSKKRLQVDEQERTFVRDGRAYESAEMRVRGTYTGAGDAWRGYLLVKRWRRRKQVKRVRRRAAVLVALIRELDDEGIKELLCEK